MVSITKHVEAVLMSTHNLCYGAKRPVLGEMFEEFTIYGNDGHLGHMTRIIYKHIDFPFIHIGLPLYLLA